jgi:hypothetical protein
MQTITSTIDLKTVIWQMEIEQAAQWQQVREQFNATYESFKPVNLIKSNLKEVVSSRGLFYSLLTVGLSLASGYYSTKLVVGSSGGIFRKLLGSALQMGVSAFSAKQAYALQTNGQSFLKRLFRKNEPNPN